MSKQSRMEAKAEPADLPSLAASAAAPAAASTEEATSSPLPAGPAASAAGASPYTQPWDPLDPEFCRNAPSATAIHRLKSELGEISRDSLPGIFVIPDESNILMVHALLFGPEGTPYDSGFFYFLLRFPDDYPLRPPRAKLLTTDQGRTRFNPNLYKNGKVCLSILGTWTGPGWKAIQTLSSVLLSIQSLMCENPYHNEPGFESERERGHSQRYNNIIQHETIRVAVLGMAEDTACTATVPTLFKKLIRSTIPDQMDHFLGICDSLMHLDGQPMADPFGEQRGSFQFRALRERLVALRTTLEAEESSGEEDENTDDDFDGSLL